MRNFIRSLSLALLSATAIFTSAAQASIISHDFSALGAQKNPSKISWNFNAAGGDAILHFQLAGFKSLDGHNNGYTDIFHLSLNGTEIFTGSFNLGGGGSNAIFYNPNGGNAVTTTFKASDDPHNSQQVTLAGGVSQITLPIDLLLGANFIQFAYSGVNQGLQDESWGINLATVITKSKISVPEPNALILLMAGLLGIAMLRRRLI